MLLSRVTAFTISFQWKIQDGLKEGAYPFSVSSDN
jgi:hypothetical protein